jgi:hypothetical protein
MVACLRSCGGSPNPSRVSRACVAILARGNDPVESRRGLSGDSDDIHSRYIEARTDDVLVGCLYLPNGNPAPGPKYDYKLRWSERFVKHAETLLATGAPVVLAGDYNIIPTDLDVYKPERWVDDALFRPEVRDTFARLVASDWTGALRELLLFGITFEMPTSAMLDYASTICFLVRRSPRASSARASIAKSAAGKRRAIMRLRGWKSRTADALARRAVESELGRSTGFKSQQ